MTSRDREPVQVFCRIRPLESSNQETCVTVMSDSTVQVVPPETSQGYRTGITKVINEHVIEVFAQNLTSFFLCCRPHSTLSLEFLMEMPLRKPFWDSQIAAHQWFAPWQKWITICLWSHRIRKNSHYEWWASGWSSYSPLSWCHFQQHGPYSGNWLIFVQKSTALNY